MFRIVLSAISVKCSEIGNCPNKTKTLDMGLTNAVQILVGLVGALAVIFVIVSGLQMVLSAGDPKRYQQGRQSLQYSVIGVVVAMLAYAVVAFLAKSLGA